MNMDLGFGDGEIQTEADNLVQEAMSNQPTVDKYMIEITRYPNGNQYQKIYHLGKSNLIKKKTSDKKDAKKVEIKQAEEY